MLRSEERAQIAEAVRLHTEWASSRVSDMRGAAQ